MPEPIDPRVTVGKVSLIVADLERSLAYYQNNIGLKVQGRNGNRAVLGTGRHPLLILHELPGARIVRPATGLYHFAILLPSRLELARTLNHFIESRTPIGGASDHLISEAIYLSDPDGHGIEIYSDRPRETWYDQEGNLIADTLRLDFDDLMGELQGDGRLWDGVHPEAVMGHVHLHVANLPAADRFYVGILGFNKPPATLAINTASFLNAGGYHHHLGLNTWAGVGAPPPPADAARLLSYEILFPNRNALDPVLDRLEAAGVPISMDDAGRSVQDPSHNTILLKIAD